MAPPVAPVRKFAAVRFVRADDGNNYAPVYLVADEDGEHIGHTVSAAAAADDRAKISDFRIGSQTKLDNRYASPSALRSRSSPHHRDSLKNRYSPGRPGSRRHQRWANETAMREQLEDEDLKELYAVEWKSSFAELFEGDNLEKWEAFCSAPEEVQRRQGRQAPRLRPTVQTDDPRVLYLRLDRRARGILNKGVGHEFVAAFESALLRLIRRSQGGDMADGNVSDAVDVSEPGVELKPTPRGATAEIDDAMERLLAHAAAASTRWTPTPSPQARHVPPARARPGSCTWPGHTRLQPRPAALAAPSPPTLPPTAAPPSPPVPSSCTSRRLVGPSCAARAQGRAFFRAPKNLPTHSRAAPHNRRPVQPTRTPEA
eukprot:CAMPEP_0172176246 /NCGR_PEP_ID=MMETSP1050-20130122/14690_1 /TAXON_ID=233186 /ORGANISM="Cryptomonas curvata, Strain CCAP979/52" /LENGTH=371 /DNA_ID=CAMNT_0012848465 /DNA_START=75 /DNA_END=1187 /DNA_ORIENTATION=+